MVVVGNGHFSLFVYAKMAQLLEVEATLQSKSWDGWVELVPVIA